MEIIKIIEDGDYKFEIKISSKSVHAHSLMTDYSSEIERMISLSPSDDLGIKDFIAAHRTNKK